MQNNKIDHVSSYYAATINEAINYPALKEDISSEVCIVGAGFTGVNTALNLAKKGYKVVLIDSARIGWGASGRNGGQLISGFTFSDKFERWGEDVAQSVWKLGADCTDLVRQTIEEFGIECDLKEGFIEVALNNSQMDELVKRKEDWDRRGYQHNLTLVDKGQIKNYVGSSNYIGGMIDSGSGHLHPLNLCLGEAKAAADLGVSIYEQTEALKVNPGTEVLIETAHGSIKAKYLVLAGNAYIGTLNPKLRRMIMPANSCIIATEPLGDERAKQLISHDMAVCDLNTILDYYRLSADQRLLFGGRWNYSGAEPTNIEQNLSKRMLNVFPDLHDLRIDYAWGGNVAVTIHRIPQLGKLTENIFYSQGYSGHGVAPTHMAAKIIASSISNEWDMIDTLSRVRHIQLPGGKWFSGPAMSLGMLFYRLKDFLDSKS